MNKYIRIVRKCKHNVRIELPDYTTKLISVEELPSWELVSKQKSLFSLLQPNIETENRSDESVACTVEQPIIEQPIIEQPIIESLESLSASNNTEIHSEEVIKPRRGRKPKSVDAKPSKTEDRKKKVSAKKTTTFHKNTNGLGVDHPFEMVDMNNVGSVEYIEGVEVPF